MTERGLGRAFARDEIGAIAATIRQLCHDTAQLEQLQARAAIFGREHSELSGDASRG